MKIRNVVTTAELHQGVDICRFRKYPWGMYDLQCYGGRCGYVKDDKIAGRVTVFLSGKMISTGGKSVAHSIEQLQHTTDILVREKFVKGIMLEPRVQNIVATANIKSKIDLNKLASALNKFILEPEQFAGGIYKSPCGPTCLIFESGKIVIAGAKSVEQVIDTEIRLSKTLGQFFINNNSISIQSLTTRHGIDNHNYKNKSR